MRKLGFIVAIVACLPWSLITGTVRAQGNPTQNSATVDADNARTALKFNSYSGRRVSHAAQPSGGFNLGQQSASPSRFVR
jgi:4-amino-4-deoxy-L-arabinose transferase-like glycosyltransferase